MSLISPNIRPPCGQSHANVGQIYIGGCFQNFDDTIAHIPIKRNVTMMKDYQSGSAYTASGVQPYAFANQNGPGGSAPNCSPYYPGDPTWFECGATGGTGNGSLPCGIPLSSDVMPCGGSPTQSFTDGLGEYHNCYVQTDETKSFASCHNIGWKAAYAYKTHWGRLGYTSRMQYGGTYPDLFDWGGCGCRYTNYEPAPDTTRYLAISANASWNRTHTDYCINSSGGSIVCDEVEQPNCCTTLGVVYVTNSESGNAAESAHVDRLSGNFYSDTCYSSSTTYPTIGQTCCGDCNTGEGGCAWGDWCCQCTRTACCPEGGCPARDPDSIAMSLAYNAAQAYGMLNMANGSVIDVTTLWSVGCYGCNPGAPDCKCTVTGGGNSWSTTVQLKRQCWTGGCSPTYSEDWVTTTVINMSIDGGTVTRTDYYESGWTLGCQFDGGCSPEFTANVTRTLSFSATGMSYSAEGDQWDSASLHQVWDDHVTGTLSSPYTADEVYDECVALLAHLPLDRDDLLPWRTDSALTTCPLVHYVEYGGGGPYVATGCQDYTGSLASGTIMGIPGPSGIDRVFNPGHWNQCVCTDDLDCTTFYNESFGAWNDAVGGGSATEWTNGYEASNIPPFAFISNYTFTTVPSTCNSAGASGNYPSPRLWMGKYAEILFPKQSFNFARPCGPKDRFAVTESSARCIRDWTDGVLQLEQNSFYPTDIQTNDLVWVCGTGDWDGCWKVTRDSDYQLTVQEPRLISASLVDAPWTTCGTGTVARIARQSAGKLDPSAICGRISVTGITAPSASAPITCSLGEPAGLVDTDQVRISNAIGGNINGLWTVKVVAPDSCVLVGSSYTPTSQYLGNGQIYSPFAVDWKWNDTTTKMDFTAKEWYYDFRTAGEHYRMVGQQEWNAGLGNTYLASGDCCQVGCGDVGTCPAPTPVALPNEGNCLGPYYSNVTCSTRCVPYSACNAAVAFYSPNGETFKSNSMNFTATVNLGFPRITMDEQYGSLWQGKIDQAILDPLFLANPCGCSPVFEEWLGDNVYYDCGDCSWRQDNGTCQNDELGDPELGIPCYKYYAAPGIFEARCSVPDGAPTTLNSQLGCLKITDTDCNSKPYCSPPWWNGELFLYDNYPEGCAAAVRPGYLAWADFLNRYNCVCNGGRFAEEYQENGIVCEDPLVTPP